jgi:hypothetical protein
MKEPKRAVRVLIVEDSPTQSQELRIILESEGFTVATAAEGQSCLERLKAAPFDLVLSDVMMPGLSGYDLCRKIKTEMGRKDIPVILLTTLASPSDIIKGLECGADNFITKPYEPNYLIGRINQILANKALRDSRKIKVGIDISLMGKEVTITSDREQILDLLISTFEEVVRSKEKEHEVRRFNKELEQRVQERTAELEAANRELEAFSYSISHDLRAPLRAINGYSSILLQEYAAALPGKARTYLEEVCNGTREMGLLVNGLLTFSRFSRQPIKKQPVEPARLVRHCLEELRGEQEGRHLQIQIGAMPECNADPTLLKQVWANLLSNALKYTCKRAEAVIEIGCRIGASPGERIYFVKDNGVGFDMRYADKLFGVFQRLHRAEEFEGTGVGLAIVHRIVNRHGGRVWAEAQPDQGTTFYFTLENGRSHHES